jgi:predicted deacetylase
VSASEKPSGRPEAPRGGAPLIVSIHDIAPGTAPQTARWLDALDARGIPATLLLVPGPWRGATLASDARLAEDMLEAQDRGHELALHGFYHKATHGSGPIWRRGVAQLMARGAAEFATLSEGEARARIRAGLEELADVGIDPVGFHPPGWIAGPGAVNALRRSGLRYYSTQFGVYSFAGPGGATAELKLKAFALSHRPGGFGEQVGVKLMTEASRRFARAGQAFRIALHPDDLTRPGLREATLSAIDEALDLGARPTTYAAALGLPRTARELRADPARASS